MRLPNGERRHGKSCPRRCQRQATHSVHTMQGPLHVAGIQCRRPAGHQDSCDDFEHLPPGDYAAQYQQVPMPVVGFCNGKAPDGTACALAINHAGGHTNPGYEARQFPQGSAVGDDRVDAIKYAYEAITPLPDYRWRTRCYYCRKPHKTTIMTCECRGPDESGYPWPTVPMSAEYDDLNCQQGLNARNEVLMTRKAAAGNVGPAMYGRDLHDEAARCTVDAFLRQLKHAPLAEVEKAFKEQERVMLSASDWLSIIANELEARRKEGNGR